jgi:hypothetical protein
MKLKEKGSPSVSKMYTKQDKIKALTVLQYCDYEFALTAKKTGINIKTLRKWNAAMGESVLPKEPRFDIQQKTINAIALRDAEQITLKAKVSQAANAAIDVIIARLKDDKQQKYIAMKDLVAIAKLDDRAGEDKPHDEIDVFKKFIEEYNAYKRQQGEIYEHNIEDANVVE